jgi:outer membrane lipoprotein carrier protein
MNRFLTAAAACITVAGAAHADGVDALRDFVRETKSGKAGFTQTVSSPDGARKKVSSGTFEFLRPNRFRFVYVKPFEQQIVADGSKVWIYDVDLNQASSRKIAAVLGSTPAAILSGGSIEKDFELSAQPAKDGLEWVLALPRQKDGTIQAVRVGFKGKDLAAIEIADSFGQRSVLQFNGFAANVALMPEVFRFTPPAGADVIEQ